MNNNYSALDKKLHDLACKSRASQVSISGIESRIFKNKLADIEIKKPVFIAALPRAGTTLLLELCVKTNEFASHTYREMPFLLTPLLWNKFSKLFRHSSPLQERAHGDGMMISVDSPEAFEEIIWKEFWPSRYKEDRIIPWTETRYPEFEDFFKDHLRKMIFLQGDESSIQTRYISKNNLNIARVGYLKRIFPDAIILIPFREPLEHASSLLRQHRNFLKIHGEDPFASKYMEDIGHYDFGDNFRPVDFNEWYSTGQTADPDTLSFWLQYWIATYRYLLANNCEEVKFISFDTFCADPERNLKQLGELIEIENTEIFRENADLIVAPKSYDVDTSNISLNLLNEVEAFYADLQKATRSSIDR